MEMVKVRCVLSTHDSNASRVPTVILTSGSPPCLHFGNTGELWKVLMPSPPPPNSDVIGLGCGLSIGIFENCSPTRSISVCMLDRWSLLKIYYTSIKILKNANTWAPAYNWIGGTEWSLGTGIYFKASPPAFHLPSRSILCCPKTHKIVPGK